MVFSTEELERYARHIMLKEIGGPGQQRLKAAHVALVGAGGLGAPAALYLAAAGVGKLTLIDPDRASLSNLQRQILYRSEDVGELKSERAAAALKALNPHVEIVARADKLDGVSAEALLGGADLILDGCDSYVARFSTNAVAHEFGVPLISGAVGRWDGQLATFKSGLTKGLPPDQRLPCYRCFVPQIPPEEEPCSAVGIVGALTGVIGAMMALEAIKEITGAGESLAGKIMVFDGLTLQSRLVRLPPDPECKVCGERG